MHVTHKQLFLHGGGLNVDSYEEWCEQRVEDGAPLLSQDLFNALKACDIKYILTDQLVNRWLSAEHLGGDDVVGVAEDIVAAIKAGYEIAIWYGPDTETLIVGYRPDQLILAD